MLFFDRLFLGRYDLHMMNAAAAIGTLCAVFQFGSAGIAHIAEVFVGQYNGAGKRQQMGWPVWQMIWFSLMLGVAVAPLVLWGQRWLIAEAFQDVGTGYYQWVMGGSFLVPMIAALASFFVGQGRVRTVTIAALAGNGVNIALDPLFIWGFQGWIPEMGARGAAMATVIGMATQALLLWVLFLQPANRKNAGALSLRFRPKLFVECMRLGIPRGLSHGLEAAAWALLLVFLSRMEEDYITVHTLGMNIFILCTFITEGVFSATIAIVSNLIGAQKVAQVPSFLKSGLRLCALLTTCVSIPLLLFPKALIAFLIGSEHSASSIQTYGALALRGVAIFFVFDLTAWLLAGVLTGGGNTKAVFYVNSTSVWIFGLLPAIFWLHTQPSTPATAWLFFAPFYAACNFLLMLWCYRRGNWKQQLLAPAEAT